MGRKASQVRCPLEPDAEDVLEFEQGDDVAWPEEKLDRY